MLVPTNIFNSMRQIEERIPNRDLQETAARFADDQLPLVAILIAGGLDEKEAIRVQLYFNLGIQLYANYKSINEMGSN